MARTTSDEMDPVNVPWSLTEIKGGSLNAEKLYEHIISTIQSIHPLYHNASSTMMRRYGDDPLIPLPPSYFRVCEIITFSEEQKLIQLVMPFWPVAVTADGCSTNIAAGNQLVKNIGLLTPFNR